MGLSCCLSLRLVYVKYRYLPEGSVLVIARLRAQLLRFDVATLQLSITIDPSPRWFELVRSVQGAVPCFQQKYLDRTSRFRFCSLSVLPNDGNSSRILWASI